jgi:hypothetical protein
MVLAPAAAQGEHNALDGAQSVAATSAEPMALYSDSAYNALTLNEAAAESSHLTFAVNRVARWHCKANLKSAGLEYDLTVSSNKPTFIWGYAFLRIHHKYKRFVSGPFDIAEQGQKITAIFRHDPQDQSPKALPKGHPKPVVNFTDSRGIGVSPAWERKLPRC